MRKPGTPQPFLLLTALYMHYATDHSATLVETFFAAPYGNPMGYGNPTQDEEHFGLPVTLPSNIGLKDLTVETGYTCCMGRQTTNSADLHLDASFPEPPLRFPTAFSPPAAAALVNPSWGFL